MEFFNERASLYLPIQQDESEALSRCSHLAIGAHQDDLEIMALHGILECYQQVNSHFVGVTVTDGAGGDLGMSQLRNAEQNKAADLGEYSAMIQLNYPSSEIKNPEVENYVNDVLKILSHCKPKVVYSHNPADKHVTHLAVLLGLVKAIRQMPVEDRPETLYGCEVWRDLDWVNDDKKVCLDVSRHDDELAISLIACFQSQITEGKRYDLATLGRRLANATFADSHSDSKARQVTHAIDLSCLIQDESLSVVGYIATLLDDFKQNVEDNLKGLGE